MKAGPGTTQVHGSKMFERRAWAMANQNMEHPFLQQCPTPNNPKRLQPELLGTNFCFIHAPIRFHATPTYSGWGGYGKNIQDSRRYDRTKECPYSPLHASCWQPKRRYKYASAVWASKNYKESGRKILGPQMYSGAPRLRRFVVASSAEAAAKA